MSDDRLYRTECNRCGMMLKYRFGAKPTYCDQCEQVIARRREKIKS